MTTSTIFKAPEGYLVNICFSHNDQSAIAFIANIPFSVWLHTIQGLFYSPIGVPQKAHLGE